MVTRWVAYVVSRDKSKSHLYTYTHCTYFSALPIMADYTDTMYSFAFNTKSDFQAMTGMSGNDTDQNLALNPPPQIPLPPFTYQPPVAMSNDTAVVHSSARLLPLTSSIVPAR